MLAWNNMPPVEELSNKQHASDDDVIDGFFIWSPSVSQGWQGQKLDLLLVVAEKDNISCCIRWGISLPRSTIIGAHNEAFRKDQENENSHREWWWGNKVAAW